MSLGKVIKTNGKFEFVELDDSETSDALNEAVNQNIGLFFNILEKVDSYMTNEDWKFLQRNAVEVATAVFNAVAIKGFTALDTALARKINDIKKNGSK
jgi:hypothetical protein